jgi:hypothetical protein
MNIEVHPYTEARHARVGQPCAKRDHQSWEIARAQ